MREGRKGQLSIEKWTKPSPEGVLKLPAPQAFLKMYLQVMDEFCIYPLCFSLLVSMCVYVCFSAQPLHRTPGNPGFDSLTFPGSGKHTPWNNRLLPTAPSPICNLTEAYLQWLPPRLILCPTASCLEPSPQD